MNIIQTIQLLITLPFNPRKNFKGIIPSFKEAFLALIVSISITTAVYSWFFLNSSNQEYSENTFHVLGFAIGLFAKNIFVAYLLMVFSRRANQLQLHWGEAFACVAYASLPLVIGILWEGLVLNSPALGFSISFFWNAFIIAVGLMVLKKINFWKASGLTFGILIIIKVVLTIFIGIDI